MLSELLGFVQALVEILVESVAHVTVVAATVVAVVFDVVVASAAVVVFIWFACDGAIFVGSTGGLEMESVGRFVDTLGGTWTF